MAVPASTYLNFDMVGIRENLTDLLFNLDPDDRPFLSTIGQGSPAMQTLHEWQSDAFRNKDINNAALEGDDPTNRARTATTRLGNLTQIIEDTFQLSGTAQAVNTAGRSDEFAYQAIKAGQELMLDLEAITSGNIGANASAASSSVARRMGGYETWVVGTNANRGATGTDGGHTSPGNTTAPGDGTLRNITETMWNDTFQALYEKGANPTVAMPGVNTARTIATFVGSATERHDDPTSRSVSFGVDVYRTPWGGTVMVRPNRHHRQRSTLIFDPSVLSLATLRPMDTVPLAKTGDSDRVQLIMETTLRVGTPNGVGIVADVN